ncbi:hypothetical protein ES703_57214 [subsurface metagenome]
MRGDIVALGMVMVFIGIVIAFLPLINPLLAAAIMERIGEMGIMGILRGVLLFPIVGFIFGVMGFMVFLAGLVAKEDRK